MATSLFPRLSRALRGSGSTSKLILLAFCLCAVLVTAACSEGESEQAAPPPAQAEPAPPPAEPGPPAPPDLVTGDATPLPPGEQHVTAFDPALSFTLTQTTPAYRLLPWAAAMTLAGSAESPELAVAFWSDLLDFLDPSIEQTTRSGAKADQVPKTADGVLEWFLSNPRLSTSEQKNITIDGVEGTEIEVELKQGEAYASELCSPTPTCAPLLIAPPLEVSRTSGSYLYQVADVGVPFRAEILDVNGKMLLILIDARDLEHQAVADQFLSTLKFDSMSGGQGVPVALDES